MLFREEYKLLEDAKLDLQSLVGQGLPVSSKYMEIVSNYEKLLKLSAKIFRISDIQGESLKKHEDENRRMNEHLRQLEQARRQFLSDISHELITPMTTIQGYIKAMLDGLVQPDAQFLRMLYEKVLHVNKLTEDLFEASKLEANLMPFRIREVCLDEFLNNISQFYALEVSDRGFAFHLERCGNLREDSGVFILMDPVRIEQVLNNMLHNAMKYSPNGGRIRITAACGEEFPGMVKFCVTDDGPGIQEADVNRVFDRYYRSEDRQGQEDGVGLGLAIAKEIVVKHQGEIGVESIPGSGSTFYFTLPARVIPQGR